MRLFRRQHLYLYRTRRPSGWGTHNGYAGRTCSPWHRDRQHKAEQPWAPLIVKRYVISLGRVPVWVASVAEYLLIKVTMPVYNVQHNRSNPRRIKPWNAKAQRAARDAGRRRWDLRPVRLVPALVVVALVAGWWLR